jgi:hypothetical protein
MLRPRQPRRGYWWQAEQGSQLAEFAISLPLLVVVLIGITDFSSAFNLKQKLAQAASGGAQLAAAQPVDDLSSAGTPQSVSAIRESVMQQLSAAGIDDCGMATAAAIPIRNFEWSYTGVLCGTPVARLTIERGFSFDGGNGVHVIASRVLLEYPFHWRFGSVAKLVAPGASYASSTTLSTQAVVPNQP